MIHHAMDLHWNDWHIYKREVLSKFYKKYQGLNKYLEAFGRNRYGGINTVRQYNMTEIDWRDMFI